MVGSQLRCYPLELTAEQSGETFVRGTVNARFLFHTRGSILRGLDVAASHMSLGERARIEVRSDYAFGEVYGDRLVPPYSTLVVIAQVAAVGDRNARWLLLRREVQDAARDTLYRVRSGIAEMVLYFACFFSCNGRAFGLSPLRLKKKSTKKGHDHNFEQHVASANDEENLALVE